MKRQMLAFHSLTALSTIMVVGLGGQTAAHAFENDDPAFSASARPESYPDTNALSEEADPEEPSAEAIDPALLTAPLEDLLVIEATSVAKKRQSVEDSAAAVYVITQEEIRKSPAGTIVDLLRTVPGVEVGHLTNGATAVSIRGFNGRNANSLLVMIDGRSVYFSGLSGVFWDQLNLPLYDIERIEIVRGPGATLWGANAVNGVINIITRNTADTLGTNVTARASTRRQELNLSHGFRLDNDVTMRAFASIRRDEMLVDALGNDLSPSAAKSGEFGARLDWQASDIDAVTIQADYAAGLFSNLVSLFNQNPLAPDFNVSTTDDDYSQFNVLARWARSQSNNIDWRIQAYYSRLLRSELSIADYTASIADLDLGLNWKVNDTHDLSFGIGARRVADDFNSFTTNADFGQDETADTILSGYIQDDIALVPDKLRLTLGAKLEHNNFTGTEFQPSARVFFRPGADMALWASVSRAARTPSRFERSARFEFSFLPAFSPRNPSPLPVFPILEGNEDLPSEQLTAFEAGLRLGLAEDWEFDVAGYYNRYRRAVSPTLASSDLVFVEGVPFPLGVEVLNRNKGRGRLKTWGLKRF